MNNLLFLFLFSLPFFSFADVIGGHKRLTKGRSFVIDHENNCFLKDGQPFKYYSGSFHYFRSPPELWAVRLKAMKLGGLDAVETYIEWSTIEPVKGQYNFSGINDIVRFIKTAQESGLLVILRPGPYICAERDLGGFPAWLQWEHPNMKFRTNDEEYKSEVSKWYSVLLPKIRPLLYSNGGPVIMVQAENEYGSVKEPSTEYKLFLRDLTKKYLQDDVILFTTDGGWPGYVQKGVIPEVYPTIDFGVTDNITRAVENYRTLVPKGPLVNSEFYVGWLDHWSEKHMKVSTDLILKQMKNLQKFGFSVNFYMYFGGTNFGFTPGANWNNQYQPDPTSYDYDAPLSESGDLTDKWYKIRQFIIDEKKANNISVSDIEVFDPKELQISTIEMPKVEMHPIGMLFDREFQNFTGLKASQKPLTFEALKHGSGFVVYSTELSNVSDSFTLQIDRISDRALIYLNNEFVGKLSRTLKTNNLTIKAKQQSDETIQRLDIMVENQGRINFGSQLGESKGILSDVLVNGKVQTGWQHRTLFPNWESLANYAKTANTRAKAKSENDPNLPTFYTGQFVVPKDTPTLFQTYLDFKLGSWHKGIIMINGHNLGRYWPFTGPQKTLCVPSTFFKPYPEVNSIVMLELEDSSCLNDVSGCWLNFVSKPEIDSKVIPD